MEDKNVLNTMEIKFILSDRWKQPVDSIKDCENITIRFENFTHNKVEKLEIVVAGVTFEIEADLYPDKFLEFELLTKIENNWYTTYNKVQVPNNINIIARDRKTFYYQTKLNLM